MVPLYVQKLLFRYYCHFYLAGWNLEADMECILLFQLEDKLEDMVLPNSYWMLDKVDTHFPHLEADKEYLLEVQGDKV